MRRQIVAGNWKMNTTHQEAKALVETINLQAANYQGNREIIVSPHFPFLESVHQIIESGSVQLAAQNCAAAESGAYTGEVSAPMLASVGVEYVIIGHSERRQYFSESDEVLLEKTRLALTNSLQPIFCIGEQLTQRESEQHKATVKKQLENTVFQLTADQFAHIIIAYEPVWAIGTGKVATPEQAQEMHAHIRQLISEKYNESIAGETTILYGGSCKPGNAADLFALADVDGGLIGGASLKADDFHAIINA